MSSVERNGPRTAASSRTRSAQRPVRVPRQISPSTAAMSTARPASWLVPGLWSDCSAVTITECSLPIAATANVHQVPLLRYNLADFKVIADLVDVRAP